MYIEHVASANGQTIHPCPHCLDQDLAGYHDETRSRWAWRAAWPPSDGLTHLSHMTHRTIICIVLHSYP